MSRLRVLVVQPYAENGGSEGWLLGLLDATDELDVAVLLLKDGPMRGQLERRGIPVEIRPVGTSPRDLVAPVRELTARLRRGGVDVVLGNVLKGQLVAGPAGRLAGVPTVWAKHDHGYDALLAAPLARVSTRVVAAVEELGEAARRRDVVIIPPPRPSDPPASREQARRHLAGLGVPFDDSLTVVMAGRLVPFKGVDDALRALALPPASDWRMVVLGSDDHAAPGETARLQQLATELGVGSRVHFAGHFPEARRWLAAFDVLAVLTRPAGRRDPGKEGFGTSAFEAMLAGVPVLAVEGGAVVRRLEQRAGIGVPASDPRAVALALAHMGDPRIRAEAGRAGREIAERYPEAPICAAMLVDVLRSAAATRHGPRPHTRR